MRQLPRDPVEHLPGVELHWRAPVVQRQAVEREVEDLELQGERAQPLPEEAELPDAVARHVEPEPVVQEGQQAVERELPLLLAEPGVRAVERCLQAMVGPTWLLERGRRV